MRLLLLAPPGAGKGTQADRISAHFAVPHISTGDLFRDHVMRNTPLGREVQGCLDSGDLVPDTIVLAIVEEAVAIAMAEAGGYVLDGFPRTLSQAREGYRVAKKLNATSDAMIHYVVSPEELMRRLLLRGEVSGRADDTDATIRHRITVYEAQTAPLLDYYRARSILTTIDGEQPMDKVTADTLAALGA